MDWIKESQKACLSLIKALEFSKNEADKDKIYDNLKTCLHNINTSMDKIFDSIIFDEPINK